MTSPTVDEILDKIGADILSICTSITSTSPRSIHNGCSANDRHERSAVLKLTNMLRQALSDCTSADIPELLFPRLLSCLPLQLRTSASCIVSATTCALTAILIRISERDIKRARWLLSRCVQLCVLLGQSLRTKEPHCTFKWTDTFMISIPNLISTHLALTRLSVLTLAIVENGCGLHLLYPACLGIIYKGLETRWTKDDLERFWEKMNGAWEVEEELRREGIIRTAIWSLMHLSTCEAIFSVLRRCTGKVSASTSAMATQVLSQTKDPRTVETLLRFLKPSGEPLELLPSPSQASMNSKELLP